MFSIGIGCVTCGGCGRVSAQWDASLVLFMVLVVSGADHHSQEAQNARVTEPKSVTNHFNFSEWIHVAQRLHVCPYEVLSFVAVVIVSLKQLFKALQTVSRVVSRVRYVIHPTEPNHQTGES
eukprot:3244726-Amphidinium_carterae.1